MTTTSRTPMSDRARIMFVDDEQRVLNSMRGMFRREFELFLTTEGAEAVRMATENPIDVVVADQRMPGMSGIDVLQRIKQTSPNTIRILLTGYADPAAIEGSINVGEVFRFLSKPCLPGLLRETLRLAVRAARAGADKGPPGRRGAAARDATNAGSDADSGGERPRTDLPGAASVPLDAADEERPARTRNAGEVGVVIYTVDSAFAETAIRSISLERSTSLATSLIRAMQALEEDAFGVLITDVTTEFLRLHRIISALKLLVPELVTVVVSDSRDSTNMISLINYGQIFRYELKPVAPDTLRQDIAAAAMKHVDLCNNPYARKRHSVAGLPPGPLIRTGYERDLGSVVALQRQRARVMDSRLMENGAIR